MKRNGNRIVASFLATTIVFLVVLTIGMAPAAASPPVPPGEEGIYFLVPKDTAAQYCEDVMIEVWVNSSVPIRSGSVEIESDNPQCGEIVDCEYNSTVWTTSGTQRVWNSTGNFDVTGDAYIHGGHTARITFYDPANKPAGVYPVGEIEVHCNCTVGCLTNLTYDWFYTYITEQYTDYEVPLENGTFTCEETFSKELPKGWNLISLPLTNTTNMTVANIMSSVSGKYDALYRYDATTKNWVLMSPSDTLKKGVGYFIHMTEAGTWSYNGIASTNLTVQLEPGLNMVGWVNTSADLPDALSSITGNYRYVARWDAAEQKFEVYVSGAPAEFNDFDTIERGEGYFIAAKTSCTLTYP